eukprot:2871403-Heterocapsa_arctica.AAC.1
MQRKNPDAKQRWTDFCRCLRYVSRGTTWAALLAGWLHSFGKMGLVGSPAGTCLMAGLPQPGGWCGFP